jgi:hypothetical protein
LLFFPIEIIKNKDLNTLNSKLISNPGSNGILIGILNLMYLQTDSPVLLKPSLPRGQKISL